MQIGLTKIIEKISQDPTNRVLIDRFFRLVIELRSEEEKAKHIMALSAGIEQADPQLSMQLAYMVYQYDHFSTEALGVIIRCLRNLGRAAKAEVLANELKKIESLNADDRQFSDEKGSRKFSIDISKINIDGVEIQASEQSAVFGAKIDPGATHRIDPNDFEKPNIPIPTQHSPRRKQEGTPAKQKSKSAPVTKVVQEQDAKQASWSGPDLGVILELFDFYFRHDLLKEALELLNGVKKEAGSMPWWKARQAILTQKMEALKAGVASPDQGGSKEEGSTKDASPNISQTLANLMKEQRYRKAMFEIRSILRQDISPYQAVQLYHLYQECTEKLGLCGLNWQMDMGIQSLRDMVNEKPQSKIAVPLKKTAS